jgi:hypothetical protein
MMIVNGDHDVISKCFHHSNLVGGFKHLGQFTEASDIPKAPFPSATTYLNR